MNSSTLLPPVQEIQPRSLPHETPNTTENEPSPILVIDMKNKRIRIYKKTLHLLGDPEYVSLLVKPEAQSFAIMRSTPRTVGSQKIRWKLLAENHSCEFYCKELLNRLLATFLFLEPDQSYRIAGSLHKEYPVVFFDLKKSTPIQQNEGDEQS